MIVLGLQIKMKKEPIHFRKILVGYRNLRRHGELINVNIVNRPVGSLFKLEVVKLNVKEKLIE